MTPYQNKAGNSGVLAYEIGKDSIQIQFTDGGIYVYSYASAGKRTVETMEKLAAAGEGLATYINQYAKDSYALRK